MTLRIAGAIGALAILFAVTTGCAPLLDGPSGVVDDGAAYLTDAEEAAIAEINTLRQGSDVCFADGQWRQWPSDSGQRLTPSRVLSDAAASHNETMKAQSCFGHRCAGEPKLPDRVDRAGDLAWNRLAENVARGQSTASQVVSAWRESSGHWENMMRCWARSIGVDRQGNDPYWTAVFSDADINTSDDNGSSGGDETERTGLEQLDRDGDCLLSDDEFLRAIDLWVAQKLTDDTFLRAIDAWTQNRKVC